MNGKNVLVALGLLIAIPILIIIIVAVSWGSSYESLRKKKNNLDESAGNVDIVLQRRNDLIPNIVNAVKGQTQHEKEVYKALADARAKIGQTTLASAVNDPAQMQAFAAHQTEMSGALSRLLVVVEQYPDLKSSEAFQDLRVTLEGTENRIGTERRRYNEAVKEYNDLVTSIFSGLVANVHGFKKAEYFKAAEEAKQVPTVDFN